VAWARVVRAIGSGFCTAPEDLVNAFVGDVAQEQSIYSAAPGRRAVQAGFCRCSGSSLAWIGLAGQMVPPRIDLIAKARPRQTSGQPAPI
jgi:hypothetical protein